jgi:hypothetical protein
MLKPEITAPGVAIFAANMGSGDEGVSFSGTSMAAPHIAGVAALMKQAHPTWSNEQIKAALMNTAVDLADVASAQVPSQGAGRVDALAAVETPVTAVGDAKFVSLSWGVIEVGPASTYQDTKIVTLHNYSAADVTLNVATMFTSASAGATLTPNMSSVVVPAGGDAQVEFELALDATLLPLGFGSMEEYYGYVTFNSIEVNLRLPFYFVPRPFSTITEDAAVTSFGINTGFGYVDMEQEGPVASNLWAYPVFMQSDNDPTVEDMADLRYVGMDYGGLHPTYGEMFTPAFAMWGDAHANQPYWSEVDLHIYADAPGDPYVVNFNFNAGWFSGSNDNNTWLVIQIDGGNVYLGSPYLIYADFNSGFQEWYLPADWQYVVDSFNYEVASFDYYGNMDYAGLASFDLTKPPLIWDILDPTWTTPLYDPLNEDFSLVFEVDDPGGFLYSKPEGIMLVDYYGKPGVGQAYFWELDVDHPEFYFPMGYQLASP